ncbi:MAG: ABC transporter permease [Chloroflexi bacterium]|nr:ABC transporter permease [Chloroflexota bacterium]
MARVEGKEPQLVEVRPEAESRTLWRLYRDNERTILGVASFVGFFLYWEIGATLGWVDLFFFSSPSRILASGFREMSLPRFWNDVRVSGTELFGGYILAVVLGIPLGICTGWYRRLNYFLDPWLNFLNALPRVALLPLIVLWVGIGIWSKILVVFLGAFITIWINTTYGVRTVDKRFLDVAHSFNASQWRVFTTVVLPGSVPFILAGLRLGVGRALIGVIVGELYSANAGIGFMIAVAGQTLQTDRLLFGVVLLTLMGVVLVELLRLVEHRFQKWRPSVGSH